MSTSTTELWASHHGDRSSGPTQVNDERASGVLGAHAGQRLLCAQYLAGKCHQYATSTRPVRHRCTVPGDAVGSHD